MAVSSEATRRLTRFVILSIAAALATIALKATAWLLTDSVGFLSDAGESIVNLVGALVALIAIRVAARPPDDDHAYGHEKAEYFSAGTEGALILAAAVGIVWVAVGRLFDPQPLSAVGVGVRRPPSPLPSDHRRGIATEVPRRSKHPRSPHALPVLAFQVRASVER